MGRRSRPKPPPDYTAQRTNLQNTTTSAYQDQADAYNTAVAEYNAKVQNAQSQIQNVGNDLRGATMANIWDDPTTAQNENYLMSQNDQGLTVDDRLNNAYHTLTNLQAPEKPVFDSVIQPVNTQWGTVTIPGQSMPTLDALSSFDQEGMLNAIGGHRSTIQGLYDDRTAEENRVKGIYGNYLTDTANFGNDISGYDITNDREINDMLRNINTLEASQYGNSSAILNQLDLDGDGIYGNEAGNISQQFTDWRNSLTGLQDARNTELERISGFGTGLYNELDTAWDSASGLNFSQTAEIQALEQLIAQKEREAGRFSSVLDYDFSGQQNELAQLKSKLQGLRDEATAATAATNSFVNTQNQQYQNLFDTAMNTGIYSKAGIDALTTQLGALDHQTSGFSGYGYDPSSVNSYYKGLISPQIANLNTRRSSALDAIEQGITGATAGLADVPLYDEDAIRAYYDNITAAGNRLNPFSGGRADTMGQSLMAQNQAVDSRIAELQRYRNTLEEEAQTMLEEIEGGSYYSLDDLTDPQARAKQMDRNIELYKSKQAMDEIELILEQLMGQKQRLELDAANVARRQGAAQGSLNMVDGVPQFGSNAITPQGMSGFYNNYNNEDEEEAYTASRSPFSNSLNAITIGG